MPIGNEKSSATPATANEAAENVNLFAQQFLIAVDFQEPVELTGATALDSLPEWDSLAALGVIVMCDTEYGVYHHR
jgi:hypothetical protein